jgi:hypothetical protein
VNVQAEVGAALKNVTAVLSMIHEAPDPQPNSATRRFRGAPVLRWTLDRTHRARRIDTVAVICWEDQLPSVLPVAGEERAYVLTKGPRVPLPEVEAVAAARRWADGWRGGPLATCHFDLGFYAPWCREIAQRLRSEAVVLIDPAAGLVDPQLLDRLVEQAEGHRDAELCFCPAAPGLGAALLRPALLDRLAVARTHPGRLLHYLPDQLSREPLAGDGCVPVAATVARTTGRFTLDSERQIARIEAATVSLNGELMGSDAEQIVRRVDILSATPAAADSLPRDVVLELNTVRATRPVFWPGRHLSVQRNPLSTETAAALFDELAGADDVRLTLAGVGDPVLSENIFEIIDAAVTRGVRRIHVETDLLGVPPECVTGLARSAIDVVSIHLPAVTKETYEAVMGIDGYAAVLENIRLFVAERHAARGRVPLLIPQFTKCGRNLGEMEAWYDQWLRALGSAVITGPSDFAGLIPDVAVADMSPPKRTPCRRLASRLTVLCDGAVVSCEQDVLGRGPMGHVGKAPLAEIWRGRFGRLRADHRDGNWSSHPTCGACREWHRP